MSHYTLSTNNFFHLLDKRLNDEAKVIRLHAKDVRMVQVTEKFDTNSIEKAEIQMRYLDDYPSFPTLIDFKFKSIYLSGEQSMSEETALKIQDRIQGLYLALLEEINKEQKRLSSKWKKLFVLNV